MAFVFWIQPNHCIWKSAIFIFLLGIQVRNARMAIVHKIWHVKLPQGKKFIAEDYPRLSSNFLARFSCLYFNLDGVMWVRFLFVQMDTRIRNNILTSLEAHSRPTIDVTMPSRLSEVYHLLSSLSERRHKFSFEIISRVILDLLKNPWYSLMPNMFQYKFLIIQKLSVILSNGT